MGDLFAALALVTVTAVITSWLLEFQTRYLINTIGLYLVVATLLLVTIPNTVTGPGLGHANRITLLRASLIAPIAAMVTRPFPLNTTGVWWVIAVSSIALILDGIDGRVSRSKQCETTFGARFDMELDAFFLLALSVLVWQSGKNHKRRTRMSQKRTAAVRYAHNDMQECLWRIQGRQARWHRKIRFRSAKMPDLHDLHQVGRSVVSMLRIPP